MCQISSTHSFSHQCDGHDIQSGSSSIIYCPDHLCWSIRRHHFGRVCVITLILNLMLLVQRIGRYWHVMFFGPWIAIVAFGLFFTLDEHTPSGKYIGYQSADSWHSLCFCYYIYFHRILAGVGIGTTTQVVVLAAQVCCFLFSV